MSALAEQIARYRNMVQGDPDDELAQFRLGQALLEAGEFAEAATTFETTLKLAPEFSKVYQLLGDCLLKSGQRDKAVEVLTKGWTTANERGDRLPMEAIGKLLTQAGAPIPKPAVAPVVDEGPETGFKCHRPGCMEGKRAKPLDTAPLPDAVGERIRNDVCSACWNVWFKDLSIKVINELRLDLSSEFGQGEYDKHMHEFLGFEDNAAG